MKVGIGWQDTCLEDFFRHGGGKIMFSIFLIVLKVFISYKKSKYLKG